jgi:hypothetical protein
MNNPAWSFTALTNFESCPRKFYLTRVAKTVKEPEGEALTWGNEVHKALEGNIRDGAPMPKNMAQWEAIVDKLKSKKGELLAEQQLCLNKNLSPTEWFAKDAWARGVVDVLIKDGKKILALDWKTGKKKQDHDQLSLFAALLFAHYPHVDKVVTGYVWLTEYGNKDYITTKVFTRSDVSDIWGEFLPRVKRFEIAHAKDEWRPKPSGLCRGWCPCSDCEFNQPRRRN